MAGSLSYFGSHLGEQGSHLRQIMVLHLALWRAIIDHSLHAASKGSLEGSYVSGGPESHSDSRITRWLSCQVSVRQ